MTDLQPYPEYIDSGVAWIGEIPSSFRIVRVGDVAQIINGFPFDATLFGAEGIPLIRIRDLDASEPATRFGGPVVTSVLVTSEDVLVGMDGDFNVGRWRGHENALLNQRMLALRAEPVVARLIELALPFPLQRINDETYATTVKHLSSAQVRAIRFPIPSAQSDVRALVAFLDRETAEIDAFIADQEELIGLLAERRAATISHAVTKGLDPSVPMKDSGVEWLGGVPDHWLAGNIRRFAQMRTGHTPSRSSIEYWEDCDIPWFTLADVWQLRQGRKYLGETKGLISALGLANSAAELLPAGTVVLSRTASVGFSGIMPHPMATSQDFWNWVCGEQLSPVFLWYQFLAMRPHFGFLVQGSTHKTIYQGDAAALSVAVPPKHEQDAIVAYLDHEIGELDAAIADAREAIALSRERRAALISAAVTGKIDVRGVV